MMPLYPFYLKGECVHNMAMKTPINELQKNLSESSNKSSMIINSCNKLENMRHAQITWKAKDASCLHKPEMTS